MLGRPRQEQQSGVRMCDEPHLPRKDNTFTCPGLDYSIPTRFITLSYSTGLYDTVSILFLEVLSRAEWARSPYLNARCKGRNLIAGIASKSPTQTTSSPGDRPSTDTWVQLRGRDPRLRDLPAYSTGHV